MKKLIYLSLILFTRNVVYCMEAERKSLASFFGIDQYHEDISQQIAQYYAAKHQWWYVEKDLVHEGPVKSACFNKAGTEILTSAYLGEKWEWDDKFYLWDSKNGIKIAEKTVRRPIEKALFNEAATDIIAITKNEGYDALYYTIENENNIKDMHRMFIGEAFFSCSKSGKKIISPHNNNKAIGIHANKHGLCMIFNNIDQTNFVSGYFNEDETELIGMSKEGIAYIWNIETQKLLLKCSHANFIGRSACFNHQGTEFLIYGASPILYIHNRERGQLLKELKHPKNIYYACFNNQDTEIFTVAADGYIRVWNRHTGCMVAKFGSHCYETLDCNKKGNQIVTCLGDRARIWKRYDDCTLSQLLLKKLLDLWICAEKPRKKILLEKEISENYSNIKLHIGLLSEVARVMRSDTEELDKEELYKTWQSFPKYMRDYLWLEMVDKILKYGK